MKRFALVVAMLGGVLALSASGAGAATAHHLTRNQQVSSGAAFVRSAEADHETFCEVRQGLCKDLPTVIKPNGEYYGHDEPTLGFSSKRPGTGNTMTWTITLPKNPPVKPKQNGGGGTWPFELRATNWLGMTMCDSQSAPDPGVACKADSDSNNNYLSTNPRSRHYIGKHPGGAYMELQFYPPSWVEQFNGFGCTARQYCAAMTIDSLPLNMNTGTWNNAACNDYFLAGAEPVNWAYITHNGVAQAPANPIALSEDPNLTGLNPEPSKDLMMNPGDRIRVYMHDTPAGFQVELTDLTTHKHGSMTASKANGFGHILYQPNSSTCHVKIAPFHPEFSTAVTRGTIWTAHSGDIAASDEIGHFELCGAVAQEGGNCTKPSVDDPTLDDDDYGCFDGAASTWIQITGCTGEDLDFDGPGYGLNWPGTFQNVHLDQQLHSSPIVLTTPVSHGVPLANPSEETDTPAFESTCDPNTGAGCSQIPQGAAFYPFYTTHHSGDGCVWDEGGRYLPNAINNFGGSATTAYGKLLKLAYPGPGGVGYAFEDYHRDLPANVCRP
jgi:hypothetical protein